MTFAPEVVAAVLHHMNDDHNDDSLLIVRAFGPADAADATEATMTGLDASGGDWSYVTPAASGVARVPWPGGEIAERPEIRREIVKLYDGACERLGLEPRAHE